MVLEPIRLRIWASIVTFFKRKSQKEAWLNPITNVISITLYNDSKDARTADYLRYRLLDDDPRYRPIQKLSLTETYKAGVQKLFYISGARELPEEDPLPRIV